MGWRSRTDPGPGSGPARYPGTFMLAFQEAVTSLKWQIRRWMGETVECTDEDGNNHVIGLENLYRQARQVSRSQWPGLIVEFLKTVGTTDGDAPLPDNLEEVADRLMVRLGPPLRLRTNDLKVWSQPLAGTRLEVNLVIDSSNRMCYVAENLVNASEKTGSQWLERALVNLRQRTQDNCFEIVDEDSRLLLCATADAYDSSRALILDHLLPETLGAGCFIAIPGRDELLVLPVSATALAQTHMLKALAQRNFKTAPYPISDDVFWVYEGTWHRLPIEIGNNEITIQPPDALMQILQSFGSKDEPEASQK